MLCYLDFSVSLSYVCIGVKEGKTKPFSCLNIYYLNKRKKRELSLLCFPLKHSIFIYPNLEKLEKGVNFFREMKYIFFLLIFYINYFTNKVQLGKRLTFAFLFFSVAFLSFPFLSHILVYPNLVVKVSVFVTYFDVGFDCCVHPHLSIIRIFSIKCKIFYQLKEFISFLSVLSPPFNL